MSLMGGKLRCRRKHRCPVGRTYQLALFEAGRYRCNTEAVQIALISSCKLLISGGKVPRRNAPGIGNMPQCTVVEWLACRNIEPCIKKAEHNAISVDSALQRRNGVYDFQLPLG